MRSVTLFLAFFASSASSTIVEKKNESGELTVSADTKYEYRTADNLQIQDAVRVSIPTLQHMSELAVNNDAAHVEVGEHYKCVNTGGVLEYSIIRKVTVLPSSGVSSSRGSGCSTSGQHDGEASASSPGGKDVPVSRQFAQQVLAFSVAGAILAVIYHFFLATTRV